jgi:TetR/AcrR family transcriptional repressor of nem operon
MARTRTFDEADTLDRAMRAFWERGYKGTSLDQLLSATGLSKSSLYASFGDKRTLLLRALERYGDWLARGPAAPLMDEEAARPAIEAFFRRSLDNAAGPNGQRGCLANNCAAEAAPHDPAIRQATLALVERIERALQRAVARGQADGSIQRRESPEALARFLFNTVSGLNVAARAQPGPDRLEDIVRVALSALDPP